MYNYPNHTNNSNNSSRSAAHQRVLDRAGHIINGGNGISYSNLLTTNPTVTAITTPTQNYQQYASNSIYQQTYPTQNYQQTYPTQNYQQLDNQIHSQIHSQNTRQMNYSTRATRRAVARSGITARFEAQAGNQTRIRNRAGVVPHPTKIINQPIATSIVPLATTTVPTPTGTPVSSQMTVLSNTPNALNFNLASPVFDANFNTKQVLQVKMVNNYDGSVKFLIVFQGSSTIPHYPARPQDYYYIPASDLNSPIFKGMHYFQSTSM